MAPRKDTAKASATTQKVAGARVEKLKRKPGPVRRLENGLLDVDCKSGKYLDVIKQNSQTPLLRLPAEIRSQIWEYALGGRELLLKLQSTWFLGHPAGESTRIANRSKKCLALLQTCRQIHAETVLLPFKLSIFSICEPECLAWFDKLLVVQREAIQEVHIFVWTARYRDGLQVGHGYPLNMSHMIPLELFPGLKRIVFPLRMIGDISPQKGDISPQKRVEIIQAQGKIEESIRSKNNTVKIVFKEV